MHDGTEVSVAHALQVKYVVWWENSV